MTESEEISKAIETIRNSMDEGVLDYECSLQEAVALLISQRDNARHYANSFRKRLKELGEEYV